MVRSKPKCPTCDRYGKVYKTSLSHDSWACRGCNTWFVGMNLTIKSA